MQNELAYEFRVYKTENEGRENEVKRKLTYIIQNSKSCLH